MAWRNTGTNKVQHHGAFFCIVVLIFWTIQRKESIMKDKSTKQQWPRSAKVTVLVLGIVLVLSLVWQLSFCWCYGLHVQKITVLQAQNRSLESDLAEYEEKVPHSNLVTTHTVKPTTSPEWMRSISAFCYPCGFLYTSTKKSWWSIRKKELLFGVGE